MELFAFLAILEVANIDMGYLRRKTRFGAFDSSLTTSGASKRIKRPDLVSFPETAQRTRRIRS